MIMIYTIGQDWTSLLSLGIRIERRPHALPSFSENFPKVSSWYINIPKVPFSHNTLVYEQYKIFQVPSLSCERIPNHQIHIPILAELGPNGPNERPNGVLNWRPNTLEDLMLLQSFWKSNQNTTETGKKLKIADYKTFSLLNIWARQLCYGCKEMTL